MRGRLVRVAVAAAVLAAALGAFGALLPVSRTRLLDAYVLLVGALLLAALVDATRSAGGTAGQSVFERALRPAPADVARPQELARLERAVVLASASSFDLHVRLRPHLREIAEHRLASRRGLELDEGSAAARDLLGEELWELLRPERLPPDDRLESGLAIADLRAKVDRLDVI